jgi:hypothetical protein
LSELTSFPAVVARVQTMADNGIRVIFDLPETETAQLSKLHLLMKSETYLRIIVYDADEWNKLPVPDSNK